MKLKDPSLLRQQCCSDGAWRVSEGLEYGIGGVGDCLEVEYPRLAVG